MTRPERKAAPAYVPYRRLRHLAVVMGLTGLGLLALMADIGRRQQVWADGSAIRATAVERLGFVDLALSSSARWLRSPTSSERTAPLTDAPFAFDTDPAGALLGPVEPRNAF